MTSHNRIKIFLKEYLDKLNDEGLKKFQSSLSLNEKGKRRAIPRSQLKNKTREETVDRLVQFYGEDKAVAMTVDTLLGIKYNDLAWKLIHAEINRILEQPSPELVSFNASESQRDEALTVTHNLLCSSCLNFTEHVVLQCGHSLCSTCMDDHRMEESPESCSLCLQVQAHAEPPQSVSEKNKKRRRVDSLAGCRNDSESNQTSSKKVKEKRKSVGKVRQFCNSSVEQIKSQSRDAEKKIKDDFETLHNFLKTEEETSLAALKLEETQKINMMQLIPEMNRKTRSLSDSFKKMEDCGVDNSFIQAFRTQMERTGDALPDPQEPPPALINVSEHVENLKLRVWKKMLNIIPHTTVLLDPSATSLWLSLCDGPTRVTFANTWQQFPGTSRCNTADRPTTSNINEPYVGIENEDVFYPEGETKEAKDK